MQESKRISVILPARNEAGAIGGLIKRIRAVVSGCEIIVVDDGSDDSTYEVAKNEGAIVIRHPYNIGNGSAVKTGIRASKGDIVVLMDADGQHLPEDMPKLIEAMEGYDMVVGSRTRNCRVSFFRRLGNAALIKAAEILSGHSIPDLTSGFRAIRKERVLEFLHLFPNRYSYPTTITLSMLKSGYFVRYLPLDSISCRKEGTSGLQPFRDGIRFINIMVRIIVLFEPQKVFMPASAVFFMTGIFMALHSVIMARKIVQSAALFIVIGSFIFFFGLLAEQIAAIRRELNERNNK